MSRRLEKRIPNRDYRIDLLRSVHYEATRAGLLRSSHTPTLGGLAVALALAAMGGDLGAEIALAAVPVDGAITEDGILFSESNSRFVVTCAPEKAGELESLFHGLSFAKVGVVTEQRTLKIGGVIEAEIETLRNAFRKTLWGI